MLANKATLFHKNKIKNWDKKKRKKLSKPIEFDVPRLEQMVSMKAMETDMDLLIDWSLWLVIREDGWGGRDAIWYSNGRLLALDPDTSNKLKLKYHYSQARNNSQTSLHWTWHSVWGFMEINSHLFT